MHPLKRPKRTKTPRSLVDAASWSSSDAEARVILAAGVQQRLVRATDMLKIIDAVPNLRRRKVIRLTLRDIGYPSFAIREEPQRVAAQVAEALRTRGWTGGA